MLLLVSTEAVVRDKDVFEYASALCKWLLFLISVKSAQCDRFQFNHRSAYKCN